MARSFIASLAFNRRGVTQCFQDSLGIIRDTAIEVVTVDRLERERLKYCADMFESVRPRLFRSDAPHQVSARS